MNGEGRSQAPRTIYVCGVSLRIRRRTAVYVGLATGRYWSTGAEHNRWHTDVRLSFAQVGVVRALPDQIYRLRTTFMGWRGVDDCPRPELREWRWPSAATRSQR